MRKIHGNFDRDSIEAVDSQIMIRQALLIQPLVMLFLLAKSQGGTAIT